MTAAARTLAAVATLALFVGGLAWFASRTEPPPADDAPPAFYRHDSGSLVLTYHPMTDTVALFDAATDPRLLHDLSRERPADTQRLCAEFLARVGATSLAQVRAPDPSQRELLKGLGYK